MSTNGAALWPAGHKGIYSRSEAWLSPPRQPLPGPLYSASFHITDLPETVNPVPRGRGEGGREGGQDYLSPSKLHVLTGEKDLSLVTYLEMEVNTTENSLGNFGRYLPSLRELRLTSSVVPCVRDLGTSLGVVAVLWMARCHLKDLDGLGALSSLQELYVSYNEISDISLVSMLPSLEVLDIESNNLSEEDQLGYLGLCPALSSLTLDGNPLCHILADREGGEAGYRSAVHTAIPHLRTLDDAPLAIPVDSLSNGSSNLRSQSSVFQLTAVGMDVDWRMVQRGLKEWRGGEEALEGKRRKARPKTAPAQRQPLPLSPCSQDDSSELTHGLSQVICGNPVRALKARRQLGLISQSVVLSPPPPAEDVLSELEAWRLQSSPPPQSVMGEGVRGEDGGLSASLQAEGISITKARSEENLLVIDGDDESPPSRQTGHFTSSASHHHRRLPTPPSHPPFRLPSPPSHPHQQRPKSVADFRHRRLRRVSDEGGRSLSTQPNPLTPSQLHPSQQSHSAVPVPRTRRLLPTPPFTPGPPHTLN